jgi:hypothetical protein
MRFQIRYETGMSGETDDLFALAEELTMSLLDQHVEDPSVDVDAEDGILGVDLVVEAADPLESGERAHHHLSVAFKTAGVKGPEKRVRLWEHRSLLGGVQRSEQRILESA